MLLIFRIIILCLLCVSSISHAQQARILFLGDSLTAGYGIPAEKAYPSLLAQMLTEQGYNVNVQNAGINGSTSASALKRLHWHLDDKPTIVFLALGANDGLRGLSVAQMKSNLQQTITLAQQNGIKVILAGIQVPPNYGFVYQRKFNNSFHELSKENQLVFVPFLLEGVAAHPQYNLRDGIHPNVEGHKHIAQLVLTYVKQLL